MFSLFRLKQFLSESVSEDARPVGVHNDGSLCYTEGCERNERRAELSDDLEGKGTKVGEDDIPSIQEYLTNGSPVAELSGNEFQKDGVPLTDKVVKFWNENNGGKVNVPGVGDVIMDLESVKSDVGHKVGKAKSAAFAAVADVMKNGKVYNEYKNWKGRQWDTKVIGAPITLDGKRYVCEAIIKKDVNGKWRLYNHECEPLENAKAAWNGKGFSRMVISGMTDRERQIGAAKRYLSVVQDEAIRRHADGRICRARSAETCPFNKRGDKVDKKLDPESVSTESSLSSMQTAAMVEIMKDFVPGLDIGEVDEDKVENEISEGGDIRQQAAMAATGYLADGDIDTLANKIEQTTPVDIFCRVTNLDVIKDKIQMWKETAKSSDRKRLAKAIYQLIQLDDRIVFLGKNDVFEITPMSISEVLAHVNPHGSAVEHAVMEILSAASLIRNGVLFYREKKGNVEFLNYACNIDDGDTGAVVTLSLEEVRPGLFHLHAMNKVQKTNTDGTKEGSLESEKLNYSTGASIGIIAKGVLSRQWGNLEDFEEFLRKSRQRNIRRLYKNGNIAGWYDRNTGKVRLVKGVATPATVAHEIGWHATFHWAEKNHPDLYKTLVRYAKEAPDGINQSVIQKYGTKLTPNELLDEIGAERFTREDISPLLSAAQQHASRKFFDKVGVEQDKVRKEFLTANHELSSAELDEIAKLEPKQAVETLVKIMVEGRALGKTAWIKNQRSTSLVNSEDCALKRYLAMVSDTVDIRDEANGKVLECLKSVDAEDASLEWTEGINPELKHTRKARKPIDRLPKKLVKQIIVENCKLIKTIDEDLLPLVAGKVYGMMTGKIAPDEFVDWCVDECGVEEWQAIRIARDQIVKAQEWIKLADWKKRGVNFVMWCHSNKDKEPRDYHIKQWDGRSGIRNGKPNGLDGFVFRIDDPPVIDKKTGQRGMPSTLIGCKCFLKGIRGA